jgi:LEA14-like dessication related protein
MKATILVFLLSLMIISCKNPIEPVFEHVENLKLGKPDLTETALSVDVRFNNLNSFGARIKTIDFDLYVDSSFIGHFTNTRPVRIRGRESFILPLSGRAQTLQLMQQTSKAFAGQKAVIRVEGKARVGRSLFYKTITFNHADTLFLKDIIK